MIIYLIIVLHITPDAHGLRLRLFHAYKHHFYPIPQVYLLINIQIDIHLLAIIILNHQHVFKLKPGQTFISVFSFPIIDLITPHENFHITI